MMCLDPSDSSPRPRCNSPASSRTSRQRWKLIGEALKVGREAHAGTQAFGAWCIEHGFGGVIVRVCSAAIQALSIRPEIVSALGCDIAHPVALLAAVRKLTAPVKPKVLAAPVHTPPAAAGSPPLTVHDAHLIEAIGSRRAGVQVCYRIGNTIRGSSSSSSRHPPSVRGGN